MSTFSGLNTATTALWAARRGLDVTGQNIANVNTDGYSRQRVNFESIGPSTSAALYATPSKVGGGVSYDDVQRIRDAFLESRAQGAYATQAQLTQSSAALSQVESAFQEPGDDGLQAQLGEMWNDWSAVSNNPSDVPTRTQLLQQTKTVATSLNTAAAALDTQWSQTRENLGTTVAQANSAAQTIAGLNKQIAQATAIGQPTNELADKRDALAMTLAKAVGGTTQVGTDGTFSVLVGGRAIVSGQQTAALSVTGSSDPSTASADPVRLQLGGTDVTAGGTAAGYVTAMSTTIPTYRSKLDAVAAGLAVSVNAGQAKGYDANGDAGTALLGSGSGGGAVTAANISLVTTDASKVAASSVAPGSSGPAVDGGNADAIAQTRLDTSGPTSTYRQMVVDLGLTTSSVSTQLDAQQAVINQVDSARDSDSGVNIDEEMTNMLMFQHSYQAAGRLVTAIDESLDVLINHTGLVGR